jgi:hypothetical protein
LKRKIVIDLTRHGGSGWGIGVSAIIPTDPPTACKIDRSASQLLHCGDGPQPLYELRNKSKKIKALTRDDAILTWLDALSMVRAAFEGDGA